MDHPDELTEPIHIHDAEHLRIPADRPRFPFTEIWYNSTEFVVPAATARRSSAATADSQGGLALIALTAFQVVLARWCGVDLVAVELDTEQLWPTNCLPLGVLPARTDLSGNPTFRESLSRVRKAVPATGAADVRFRYLRVNPHYPASEKPTPFRSEVGSVIELALELHEHEDGDLRGYAHYLPALFDETTVLRLCGHFVRVLELANADMERRIGQFDLLSAAERRKILAWNDTEVPELGESTLHKLFEEQVARTPGAIAVVGADRELSYGEVNVRANQLAWHLAALGIGPGTLVAVSVDRSPEMVISLLGVLKAGGAYVALDPSFPVQRLRFIADDTQAVLVITTSATEDTVRGLDTPMLVLDDPAVTEILSTQPTIDPAPRCKSGDLAYVCYTSGSTGKPKGVAIEHHSAVNYLRYFLREVLRPTDFGPILLTSSPAQDASVRELFGSLAAGAKVVLAPARIQSDPVAYLEQLRAIGARNILAAVPSVIRALIEQNDPGDRDGSFDTVLTTGEPASRLQDLAGPLKRAAGRLVNHYGPTECTVTAVFALNHGSADGDKIGRPIANTQVLVIDRFGSLAPVGVPGELWIGGAGVARSYWRRPGLTAARFVPHPCSDEPSARMYRTGDLGRWLPDGTLEFRGRMDRQIKLRGIRIELEEIESVVGSHPDVIASAAAVREDEPGDQRLVAYYVPATGKELAPPALRQWCETALPEHIVPAHFVAMSAFPATPTGKIDRQALPAPGRLRTGSRSRDAPRNATEEGIARLWDEVLGVDGVDLDDSFFDLGGHSLLATKLTSRIRAEWGISLPVAVVFDNPTISDLAAVIDSADVPRRDRGVLARDSDAVSRLSYAQQRMWFLDQVAPESSEYVMTYTYSITGDLSVDALDKAFSWLLARHDVLRARFVFDHDGDLYQETPASAGSVLNLAEISGAGTAEDAAHRLLTSTGIAEPFALERGGLVRAAVAQLGPGQFALAVVLHHIVADGWSMRLVGRDLGKLYEAAVTDSTVHLPELPVQYADFAAWQRDRLSGPELSRQLDYWRDRLDGLKPLALPTDRPRPPVWSANGGGVRFMVPNDVMRRASKLAREKSASLFMVGLAAFLVVLSRWSGQSDVAVGTPVAGRDRPEIEDLVGFFTNTVVIRSDLSGSPSFTELVTRVREVALGAYAHQEVPFERIVEELAPTRDLSRNPLVQINFMLETDREDAWTWPGLELRPVTTDTATAKFDILLGLAQHGDGRFHGELVFSSDLFDRATADRMTQHFLRVLDDGTTDPQRPINGIDILSDAERRRLLGDRG
ncbi:amino acid adenylation domain-containing protein [Amycolatopsis sp. PS_44_ISF1]|uniref:amino acid adenylation domain-containing protein n=1 Tax=Amycolatopsis sp. PS_44_ISF1 TaxID=2974917 RepID=UPI0028DEB496|nr:amino acid adenylation domain-containing protein [Amycolatopsis sp. PS_44_ISF1]MDT8916003.1 amino acid adenylation domain-containing protein [Amycolatopsis sp. PS_44_ISF1]